MIHLALWVASVLFLCWVGYRAFRIVWRFLLAPLWERYRKFWAWVREQPDHVRWYKIYPILLLRGILVLALLFGLLEAVGVRLVPPR
jgi:hypothetical protein